MEDILKIVKSLEDFVLLLKGASERIQNMEKEQKAGNLFRYIRCKFIRKYASR